MAERESQNIKDWTEVEERPTHLNHRDSMLDNVVSQTTKITAAVSQGDLARQDTPKTQGNQQHP